MKKLYLLLDDWDNDRNFVGRELELLCGKYDVTIICDSAKKETRPGIRYLVYSEPSSFYTLAAAFKAVFDADLWREIRWSFNTPSDVRSAPAARISEIFRFYIKADLFRVFMKKAGCFENGVIYYSYWNFRKCYAVTHEMHRYPDSRAVSRIHGYELYDEQIPSGYQPFKRAMDSVLSRLVFVSEHGMEYYLAKYHMEKSEKYGLYFLGTVPHEGIGPYTPDGVITLVSCSRIDANKRVGLIARGLSLTENVMVRWIHFGTGELYDEVKGQCEDLLKDKPNVSYELKGQVANAAIHDFYASEKVDFFITASSSEGNPVSVMEALSYGIPVIAPAVCNFPNMIRECGILVPESCEPEDMAEAVRRASDMPEEQIKLLRDSAYRCWDENYNADRNNKRFVEEVIDRL